MISRIKRIFLVALIFVSGLAQAQNGTFDDFLRGGEDDAEVLLDHYMSPFLKAMGYGFNNGWYNTAKPHKTLGFDVTFSANVVYVPVADQSFKFDPAEYQFTSLQGGSDDILPTIAGGPTQSVLQVTEPLTGFEQVVAVYPAPDGLGEELSTFQNTVPSPIIQAGVGLIKGTEIKIRWMPTVNQQGFSLKYFGVGGLHSISQWLPVFKDLPVDISGFIGYTKIDALYNIPEGNIAGENQVAEFKVNTLTFQVIASAHVSVLTGYLGLGMDSYTTNLNILGTYAIYENDPIIGDITLLDPIKLERTGNNGFRTTIGVRLKLAIVTLHADYTIREYNTLTAGLGFSFR
jgi:hypothetical protein